MELQVSDFLKEKRQKPARISESEMALRTAIGEDVNADQFLN